MFQKPRARTSLTRAVARDPISPAPSPAGAGARVTANGDCRISGAMGGPEGGQAHFSRDLCKLAIARGEQTCGQRESGGFNVVVRCIEMPYSCSLYWILRTLISSICAAWAVRPPQASSVVRIA